MRKEQLDLKTIKGIVMDIDGTLLREGEPMPGLMAFFNFLQQNDIKFIAATNNATRTPKQYQRGLESGGMKIKLENVLTASIATSVYLKEHYPNGGTAYVIGKPNLHGAVHSAGFDVVDNAENPVDVVIVGGDSGLTYDKLKFATLLIPQGAKLIGTNPDVVYPSDEGLVPEAGTTLAALKASTGADPIIIGKPQPFLFQAATKKMGTTPEHTAMLGDRLDTDICGGQNAGLKTILVTTGVDNGDSVPEKKIYPDLIVSGLPELTQKWHDALNCQ